MACSTEVRFPDLALFCRTKRAEQPASLECPRNCMTSLLSRWWSRFKQIRLPICDKLRLLGKVHTSRPDKSHAPRSKEGGTSNDNEAW